jgi:hypothetical protein
MSMTPDEEIAQGRKASRLLRELAPYFEERRTALINEWTASGPQDADKRETVWRRLDALIWLQLRIGRDVASGQMAEAMTDA